MTTKIQDTKQNIIDLQEELYALLQSVELTPTEREQAVILITNKIVDKMENLSPLTAEGVKRKKVIPIIAESLSIFESLDMVTEKQLNEVIKTVINTKTRQLYKSEMLEGISESAESLKTEKMLAEKDSILKGIVNSLNADDWNIKRHSILAIENSLNDIAESLDNPLQDIVIDFFNNNEFSLNSEIKENIRIADLDEYHRKAYDAVVGEPFPIDIKLTESNLKIEAGKSSEFSYQMITNMVKAYKSSARITYELAEDMNLTEKEAIKYINEANDPNRVKKSIKSDPQMLRDLMKSFIGSTDREHFISDETNNIKGVLRDVYNHDYLKENQETVDYILGTALNEGIDILENSLSNDLAILAKYINKDKVLKSLSAYKPLNPLQTQVQNDLLLSVYTEAQTPFEKKAIKEMTALFPEYKDRIFLNGDDTISTHKNVKRQEFKDYFVWYIEEELTVKRGVKIPILTIEVEPK